MTARTLWFQVALLFAVLYLALLGVRPMITPDEPRYAGMAADMLASGEWLKFRMCGFTYYEKPPLGVWLIASSESLFGHNAFAARLPGALAALAAALAAGMVARRIVGRAEATPLACMVQLTTVLPMALGTVVVLDPVFAGFVSVTLAWFLAGAQTRGRARVVWLLAAGVASAGAFLTKGLLGLAIPALAAGSWLAWERRWREMVTLPWLPIAAATAVAGPVAWIIHRAEPGFWRYFIEVEHFRRFTHPDGNQHSQPWWLLSMTLLAGSMFWLLLWPRAMGAWARDPAGASVRRFCLAWVLVPLALLSLSAGKLPTYVLPLFAPVSAMVATGLLRWRESTRSSWDLGSRLVVCVTCLLALACFGMALTGAEAWGLRAPWHGAQAPRWLLAGLAMLGWALLEVRSHAAAEPARWLARAAWIPVPALLCIHLLLPDAFLSAPKSPWAMLARHRDDLRRSDTLATVNSVTHAVNWSTGRTDLVVVGEPSEFDNELDIASEQPRLVPHAELADASRRWLAEGGVAMVIDTGSAEILAARHADRVKAVETDRDITVLVFWPPR